MSSCTVDFKKNLKTHIEALNKRVDEGIRFDSKGRDLELLLDKYKNAYKVVDADSVADLEKIQNKEKDVLFTAFRANMKEVFEGSFSSGNKIDKSKKTKFRLIDLKMVNDEYVVKLEQEDSKATYEYVFGRGRNVSYKSNEGKGNKLYVPKIDVAFSRAEKTLKRSLDKTTREERMREGREAIDKIMQYLKGDIKELGSIPSNSKSKGIKKPDYVHGDIEHMKSVLEELHLKGKNKATDEHVEYLLKLFDSMSPSFFREMDLFINENKGDTRGWVNIDLSENRLENDFININMGRSRKFGKSEAEVYAHEVIHTMVGWALNSKSVTGTRLKRELNYVMKVAKENTEWEDLLEKSVSESSKYEIEDAKKTYEYMFNSKHANDEFIAHVLTNPAIIRHMMSIKVKRTNEKSDTLFGKAIDLFYAIVDTVLGNFNFGSRNENVFERVNSLAFQLAKINKKAENDVKDLNIFERFHQMINSTDEKLHEKIVEKFESSTKKDVPIEELPKDATSFQKSMFYMKFFGRTLFDPIYRDAFGNYMSMLQIKPDSTIREIFGSLFTPDKISRAVEWASLKNANIDTARNTVITLSKDQILKNFNRKLTEEEEIALTKVMLESNASTLLYKGEAVKNVFSQKELSEMLKNDEELADRVSKAKKKLSTTIKSLGFESEKNWIQKQAHGLGYFMATGKGHKAQLTNSENIAIGYLSKSKRKLDKNLVAAIREVATLVALSNVNSKDKKLVAELVETEFQGVNNIAGMYEAFKNESERTLFEGDRVHILEGYTKELFDDTTDVQYAPLEDKSKMESLGYELITKLEPAKGEVRTVPMGMYVSDLYGRAERLRGAVNLGSNSARGVSLRDIKYKESPENGNLRFKRDLKKMHVESYKLTQELYKDDPLDFDEIEMGVVPTLNARGTIVDYRYMTMNKEAKAKRMNQVLDVSEVLSRSFGGLIDKQFRENQNEEALKIVKEMMSEDLWDGGDLGGETGLLEYRRIGPNVEDEKMQELFYMLPSSFQEYVHSREDKVIAVPAALVNPLFGYRHAQIGDLIPKGMLSNSAKRVIQRIVNTFEAYWMDLVKIVKGNILLKFPVVQIGNILSNVFYMLNTGMSPAEIWKYHKESFRDVKTFMKNHKEMKKLQLEVKTRKETISLAEDIEQEKRDIKKLEDRVKRLQLELEDSPVFELVEAGLYQSVIEDVETSRLNDTNKISGILDRLTSKMPNVIRTGAQWAYLSKETEWYQISQEVLQLSDLVARDVMNRKMKKMELEIVEGKRKMPSEIKKALGGIQDGRVLKGEVREKFLEISKESRMNTLLDVFINYNKPNSKWEEWANRIGLVMFTKYIKRIQRVIVQVGNKHPIMSALLLAQALLFVNVDMIQDQAYLTRAVGVDGQFSFGNVIPFYDPVDLFMNAVTPAIVKPETFMGLI